MALGRVQDAVKQAFRGVRDEVIPLYMTNDITETLGNVRKGQLNCLKTTIMHDTFKVADELKRDVANM